MRDWRAPLPFTSSSSRMRLTSDVILVRRWRGGLRCACFVSVCRPLCLTRPTARPATCFLPELQRARASLNTLDERELDLRGYKIPVIENVGVTQDQFDTIDLSDNEVQLLGERGSPPAHPPGGGGGQSEERLTHLLNSFLSRQFSSVQPAEYHNPQ
jgi:hypothetical protein